MYIQQLYTNCLAESAYYIESRGEAAIIDPLRETEPYVELAKERGAIVKYIFETHFHADFVSGHIDLAEKTGAQIVFGPSARADYAILTAEDEQVFTLGDIQIKALHTPGHTMESSCFLLIDEHGKEHAIFTGDTLFVGDVGRPDLAVKNGLSKEDLASFLYQSIHEKLLPLSDDVIVYPGHGAGSQCGKVLGKENQSTMGREKQTNYALQAATEVDFVNKVLSGLNTPPQYFPKVARINRHGYEHIDEILEKAGTALSVENFDEARKKPSVLVLDSRPAEKYATSHIPYSLNVGLDGSFAVWVGTLVQNLNTPILLITEPGKEGETALRLARVGYDHVLGYLQGGMPAWKNAHKPTRKIETICPVDFQTGKKEGKIWDVRTGQEYQQGYIQNAENIPLTEFPSCLTGLNKNETYFLYCETGYRSIIAASIMQREGFKHVINIKKGYQGVINPESFCCCSKRSST